MMIATSARQPVTPWVGAALVVIACLAALSGCTAPESVRQAERTAAGRAAARGGRDGHIVADKAELDRSLAGAVPIVLEFYGPGCHACRALRPFLREMESEYAGRVVFLRINTDRLRAVARDYDVFGMPTLVFVKNTQEVARHVGAKRGSVGRIRKIINSML